MSFIEEIPKINKEVASKLKEYKKSNKLDYAVSSYLDSSINEMLDTWCNRTPEKSLKFMEYMRDFSDGNAKKELERASQYEEIANIIRKTIEDNKEE